MSVLLMGNLLLSTNRVPGAEHGMAQMHNDAALPMPTLVGALADQRRPAVASDGRDFLVVWHDRRDSSATGSDIYAARVSAAGQLLDSNGIAIATSEAWEQMFPAVASDGTNYLVVWQDNRENEHRLYGARVSPGGQVLDHGGFRISRWGTISNPNVTFNGTDFMVVLTVFRSYPHNSYALIGIRVSPSGQVRDQEGLVLHPGWVSGASAASLNGDSLVAWQEGSDLRGLIVHADGTMSSPQTISDSRYAFTPQVMALPTNYVVAWMRATYDPLVQPPPSAVLATTVSAEGQPLRTELIATNAGGVLQEHPAVAAGGAEYLVAWEQGTFYTNAGYYCPYTSDLHGARVGPDGVVAARFPINGVDQEQSRAALAFNGTHFLAVWEDARSAPPTECQPWGFKDIYGARLTTGADVLEPEGFVISAEVTGIPVLIWPQPEDITYGTALSTNELNATANMPGTFNYQPPSGTLLNSGASQVLTVTFTPRHGTNVGITNVMLNVRPAPLMITADDQFKVQGQRIPPLTASYAGFVLDDTPDDLDTPVTLMTSGAPESPPGTYPIHPSGASDANYDISFVQGTLTVLPAPIVPPVPGSVDITFDPSASGQLIGVEGDVVTVVGIAMQADGKVVFAADAYADGFPIPAIVRLHHDGSRDANFRAYSYQFPDMARLNTIALLHDGKVLAGGAFLPGANPDEDIASLARFHGDGRLDSLLTPSYSWGAEVFCLAVQPDGKVLVGGNFTPAFSSIDGLARLNADGSLDQAFAVSPTELTGGVVKAIALQPDGKIVIGGTFTWQNGGQQPSLARLNPDGTLDLSFTPGWIASSSVNSVLAADGKIIAGGRFNFERPDASAVVRLHPDGSRDTNFASRVFGDEVQVLALLADGKVLAGGWFPGVVRLNQDGTTDTDFQTDFAYEGGSPITRAITVQPDGAILVGGNFTAVNGYPMRGLVRLRSEAQLTGLDLAEALDAPQFVWTTSGIAQWSAQSDITHDGMDAAQAGVLPSADGESRLSTAVTGPGVVRFWWRVEAPEYGYGLKFFIGSALQADQTGEVDWEERVFYVPPGEQTLTWSFYVDDNGPLEGQSAWLDQVSFSPGETAPTIWRHPSSRSVAEWSTGQLSAHAAGTPPLTYQWHFNETELSAATNSVLELPYVQRTNSGAYRCVIANAYGATTSAVAVLTVRPSAVVAWGDNYHGQSDVPLDLTNIVAVAEGTRHSLALRDNGTVVAWGDNEYGQTSVPDLTGIVAIAAGGYHNLALTDDGRVIGWGANWDGQAAVPPDVTNVVAIEGGGRHSLAIRADGTVAAWGINWEGEISVPPDLSNVVAVAGGDFHSLALRSDGTVVAWGASGAGIVNRGQANVPSGLSNVVAIVAGQLFSLALKNDGRVVSWGSRQDVPEDVLHVVGISAGTAHALARTSDGSVVAWGWNGEGQTTVPPRLPNVVGIAAGGSHSLVLLGSPTLTARPISLRYRSGACDLSVLTRRGVAYFLECQEFLNEGHWRLLHGIAGDGGVRTLTDPAATVPQRFYRVLISP